ncbi:MAG: hypothetical protein L0H25_05540 [Micrococcales bacterium]|nr:hypothetical protein [Micrococcales bacterium]
MASNVASAATTSRATVASVERVIAAQPAGAKLPSADRAALAKSFYEFAQFVKAHPELMQQIQTGTVSPAWHVGFGWYIYFHHLTPNDQRWFMEVGVSAVAVAICAASGFDPAVCTYGGGIATILVITIDHYYSTKYCLEIQINYTISLHKAYRTRC